MTFLLGLIQRCLLVRPSLALRGPMPLAAPPLPAWPARHAPAPSRVRPLRVVRTIEHGTRGARCDGRVLISGGIDDVCAELERLAALEARIHH